MDKVFDKIFFDFDSTLIRGESLDLLGDLRGVGKEVRKMTESAMNGAVPMERVFKQKVDLIAPSLSDVHKISRQCADLLVEDAGEVMSALHALGKKVYVLSSNFHQIINPIAAILAIPPERIIANDLYFDEAGNYHSFNHASPLCCGSGKAVMLRQHLKSGKRCVCIGDGSADLSCKGIADLFIGFGGVADRPVVRENADLYFAEPNLAPLILMILTSAELDQVDKLGFAKLLMKAQKKVSAKNQTDS